MEKAINSYIESLRKSGLSDKTLTTYGFILKYFKDWIEERGINDLNLNDQDIHDLIAYLKDLNLSPTTIKMVLNRVKDFLEFKGIEWNISKRIYRERARVESAKPFSMEELSFIFKHLKNLYHKYYPLALILYGFGLRISEAVRIRKGDILKKEGSYFVYVSCDIAKFSKSREAPLILKGDYKDDFLGFVNTATDFLFSFDDKTAKVFFNRLSKRLGLHITAHRFRDTYISYMVAKGIKPLTVAKWVGHKDITTTLKYYAKLTTKEELEELNKL